MACPVCSTEKLMWRMNLNWEGKALEAVKITCKDPVVMQAQNDNVLNERVTMGTDRCERHQE